MTGDNPVGTMRAAELSHIACYWQSVCSALALRSAHVAEMPRARRRGARVSKGGGGPALPRPHASRRIAARSCLWKRTSLPRAAMLLSMRPNEAVIAIAARTRRSAAGYALAASPLAEVDEAED
jgi:hypothetical protein